MGAVNVYKTIWAKSPEEGLSKLQECAEYDHGHDSHEDEIICDVEESLIKSFVKEGYVSEPEGIVLLKKCNTIKFYW